MAEETVLTRRNKKVAGIEDPIVIVQRLLNIYRQLHILTDEQKKEFNDMILQQPSEIRHMCSVLPGGSLLQEYIDDLEVKNGISDNASIATQTNILADALSEKQEESSSAPKNTQDNELQKQMLQLMKSMQQQNSVHVAPQNTPTNVVNNIQIDDAFAQNMASALSDALEKSDKSRRRETMFLAQTMTKNQKELAESLVGEIKKIKYPSLPEKNTENNVKIVDNTSEITKAITESQLEMAKMFLQHNAINASQNNNANNIQINNQPVQPLFDSKNFLSEIITAQSQLFREMAQIQTKEISEIITHALKENYQLSNSTLMQTLGEFQKENIAFLKEHAKHYSLAPKEPDCTKDDTSTEKSSSPIQKVLNNFLRKPAALDEENEKEKEEENEHKTTLDNDSDNANLEMSENSIIEQDDNLPSEINLDNLSSQQDSQIDQTFNDLTAENSNTELASTKKKKKKKKKKKNKNLSSEDIVDEANEELMELLDFDTPEQLSSNETFVHDEEIIPYEDLSSQDKVVASNENDISSDVDLNILDESEPKENISPIENQTDETNISASDNVQIVNDKKQQISAPSEEKSNTQHKSVFNNILKHLNKENALEDLIKPFSRDQENTPKENPNNSEIIEFSTPTKLSEESDENLQSQQKVYEESDENNLPLDAQKESETADDNTQDWEWDYEELPDDNFSPDAPKESETADDNVQDWEWDYEELPDDLPLDAQNESETADDNTQDWEWGYEELPDNNLSLDAQKESETADDNAQDWEWAYEGIPDDDNFSPNSQNETKNSNSEQQDWEWAYEELPDDDAHQVSAQTQKTDFPISDNADKLFEDFSNDENFILPNLNKEQNDADIYHTHSGIKA